MRDPLNPRQLEVLQWIADGSPEGVMPDETHKLSAAALKNRHLVTVSKRGGWHATITDAGRHYLEHGEYLEAAKTARAPAAPATKTRTKSPAPSREPAATPASPSAEPPAVAATPVLDEVVDPAQQQVPVPAHLRNPHPVVVALRDDKRQFGITHMARNRALRIIQGLISAAEREGFIAKTTESVRDRWGNAWSSKDDFVIDTGECRIGIRVLQESDRTAHVPTAHELKQKERNAWVRIPDYDHTPSERLRIEVGGWSHGRQSNWSDRKRWALEDKLPNVLGEIRTQHGEAVVARIEKDREEAERQQRWEAAVATAKIRLRESHRAELLVRQAERWQQAHLLREYVESLRVAAENGDPVEAQAMLPWIQWAGEYAERIDPLNGTIAMPADPEPTPDALKPFLGGWSPYGPRG